MEEVPRLCSPVVIPPMRPIGQHRTSLAEHQAPGPATGSGFDAWMAANGFTDPVADPDGDGLSHLTTYFTGADLVADPHNFLTIDTDSIATVRRRSGLSGASGNLETSTDLRNWTALPENALGRAVDAGNGTEHLTATIDVSENVVYVRLRTTR